ncbi:MAG: ABC transporter substrate-binding protein [Actinomycetota bacterium]|nr:ABC transporter substrate-binding protein [Actinomycetota bacterium]
MAELPTGTVTFLFTDIEGSTAHVKRLGERYGELLDEHQRLLREAFAAHGGREIDTQGDSFMVAFARAKQAVAAAVEAQRALAGNEWPDGSAVLVRMGLHSGEPTVGTDRYHGLGVHRAARIAAAGHGGQVLLSSATRELVEDDLPPGVGLRDLGAFRLKDIDRPERLTQLVVEGLADAFPPVRAERAPVEAVGWRRHRTLLTGALAGVIAAAVAVPLFALGGGQGGSRTLKSLGGDAVGVIDPVSAQIDAQVSGVSAPGSIAEGKGAVWATSANAGTLARIDEASRSLRQTIAVGNGPSGVAIGGGAVWVANRLDGTVARVNPATNGVVQTIRVGNGPAAVAFGAGAVWVTNVDDRTLSKIDPKSGRVLRTVPTGAAATGAVVGAGSVWVTDTAGSSVTRLDVRTSEVTKTINVGSGPTALAYGAGSIWVANTLDGTVSRIDAHSGVVIATVRVGVEPSWLTVADGSVWVSDDAGRSLVRVDPATNAVSRTLAIGNRPAGIVFGGGRLWLGVQPSVGAHRGGTLVVDYSYPLDSLDPAAYTPESWGILSITNDGLLAYRRSGGGDGTDVVPDLAAASPTVTDGGRTYTFRVRSGIRYSNGAPVAPADFRYALERMLRLGPQVPEYQYLKDRLVGARSCTRKRCNLDRGIVVDATARTVTFHLVAPDADFLDTLALPFADAVPAGTPPLTGNRSLPATGPYMIEGYTKHGLRLVRNPQFHQWSRAAKPDGYPDRIVLRFRPDPERALTEVERGSADLTLDSPPPDRLNEIETEYAAQVHVTPTAFTRFLQLNTRVPPFDDVRARRALNYALDRGALVRAHGGPQFAQPTCQVLPPNYPGYRPYCPYTLDAGPGGIWTAPDIARAQRLVAASGTRGQHVTLWYAAWVAPLLPVVRSTLEQLGYRVSVKRFTSPDTYFPAIGDSRNRVQVAFFGWIADYPAASNFFRPLLTCASFQPNSPAANLNGTEFCDRHVDALVRQALAAQISDPGAAAARWAAIDRTVVDEAPYVPFFNERLVDFVSKRVGDFQRNLQYGVLLDQLWVR